MKEGDEIEIHVAGARTFEVKRQPGASELLERLRKFRGACLPISTSIAWKPTSVAERFFDTNVLLYLLSGDSTRADRAEAALATGGVLSVQVLNEFASVAMRKIRMPLDEIREVLAAVRAVCKIVPITEATHDKGLEIADRYGLSIHYAMIARM